LDKSRPIRPHNLPFAVLVEHSCGLLVCFNAGSALAADGLAPTLLSPPIRQQPLRINLGAH